MRKLKERTEKIFCDLTAAVKEKENVSGIVSYDKWTAIPYETKHGKGVLLTAAQNAKPAPVTLSLGLKGWHRIFIATIPLSAENETYFKLSGDPCFRRFRSPVRYLPRSWSPREYIEENYWRSADLTDNDIIMARPVTALGSTVSGIVWVRCVAMTESEAAECIVDASRRDKRCIHAHIDEDFLMDDDFGANGHIMPVEALKDSDVEMLSIEASFFTHDIEYKKADAYLSEKSRLIRHRRVEAFVKRDALHKSAIAAARRFGIRILAACRMSVADVEWEYPPDNTISFTKKHPEFYCRNRDGSVFNTCSYAYPQVRKYMIEHLIRVASLGFDGITLIMHRGLHVGFEKPVKDMFAERYPAVDPCRVPASDPRLHGVWGEIMTIFMRELQAELNKLSPEKRLIVNVVTDYGLETAKHFGTDIERWAKEGLIDSVCQANMEVFEDLTDCISDTEPDLIDLVKYSKQILERPVIRRNFSTDVDKICRFIPQFKALKYKYGIEVYHTLPWERTVTLEGFARAAEQMRLAGADKFLDWDTNHSVWDWAEWHTISRLGRGIDDGIPLRGYYRTLSLGGVDISGAHSAWRG